jgi:fatty-acyl-CoA synthase
MTGRDDGPDVWETFTRNCRFYRDRIATHFEDIDRTYAELHLRAERLAAWLSYRYSVGAGDVVAVASLNRPEILETMLAAARLGATLYVVNNRFVPTETATAVQMARAKLVLAEPRFAAHVTPAAVPVVHLSGDAWPSGGKVPSARYDDLVAQSCPAALADHANALDAALLMVFTSGSTGRPKSVLLSQRNVLWDALGQSHYLRLRQDDRQLLATPMCWTGGLILVTQAALLTGVPIDILPAWDADAALAAVAERGCTVLGSLPVLVRDLLDAAARRAARGAAPAKLRVLVCGGGPHTTEFDTGVLDALGPEHYLFVYGLTESTGPATYTGNTETTLRKELGIGFPAWYLDHRLVDEDGASAAPGSPGELLLKGPTITSGGSADSGLTGPDVVDGWLRTGDIVREDEDGCLFFIDRAKDMIKTGGLNVYAAEVEQAVIRRYPELVSDVAVFGVPSSRWGEEVVATVELVSGGNADEAGFLAGLREMMADYKVPKRVVFVGEFPRTATGKIDKPRMRQLAGTLERGDDRAVASEAR